jgi:hypothetical protein
MIYQPSGAALHDAYRQSESIEVLAPSGALLRAPGLSDVLKGKPNLPFSQVSTGQSHSGLT